MVILKVAVAGGNMWSHHHVILPTAFSLWRQTLEYASSCGSARCVGWRATTAASSAAGAAAAAESAASRRLFRQM